MSYAYEKLMSEHNLSLSDLNDDAKYGIQTIKKIEKAVKMTEARGQNVSSQVLNKIKTNDKWVVREIIDQLEDKETNQEEIPNEADDVITLIEDENYQINPPETQIDPMGLAIDNELSNLYENEMFEITLDDLKKSASKTYKVIFENYETGEENGVSTSTYLIKETDTNIYTLTKK